MATATTTTSSRFSKLSQIVSSVFNLHWTARVLALSVIAVAFSGCGHLFAHGFVETQQDMLVKYVTLKDRSIDKIAEWLKLERPVSPSARIAYLDYASDLARQRKIQPSIVRSVIRVESGVNPHVVSPKGAIGLMQVMPFNAKACGLEPKDLKDPYKNMECGVYLLDAFFRLQADDTVRGLQAYNGGPGCVGKCKESINYAGKVLTLALRD